MNTATALNVVLLIILAYTIWSNESASLKAHEKVTKLEQGHWAARDALEGKLKAVTGLLADEMVRSHDAEELHRTAKITIAGLKGEKENLLVIIGQRNEDIKMHRGRAQEMALKLQLARGAHALVMQHNANQAAYIQQETVRKHEYTALETRNANQFKLIEALRTTGANNQHALAMYRNGELLPKNLDNLVDLIKAYLSGHLIDSSVVAKMGARLQRAVQVHRKANPPARVTTVSPTMQIIHGDPHTV